MKDNNLWEYVKATAHTDADFVYFDDKETPDPKEDRTIDDARLIISLMIESSAGSMSVLQCVMCLFAGLSLREASVYCDISHETVRLRVLKIKEKHPELYECLTCSNRGLIESLIPSSSSLRWKIYDMKEDKTTYVNSLVEFCKVNGFHTRSLYSTVNRGYIYKERYKITRRF